jgi:hypothetical protein
VYPGTTSDDELDLSPRLSWLAAASVTLYVTALLCFHTSADLPDQRLALVGMTWSAP